MITQADLKSRLHYDPETGVFTRLKGMGKVGRKASNGYIQIFVMDARYMAHRLAWLYVYGEWPELLVDHINLDRSDNRIQNLRSVTPKQNNENSRPNRNNRSGYRGVSLRADGLWQSDIRHNRKTIHLGTFKCKAQAARARAEAEKVYFTHAPDYPQISPCGRSTEGGSTVAPGTTHSFCDSCKFL